MVEFTAVTLELNGSNRLCVRSRKYIESNDVVTCFGKAGTVIVSYSKTGSTACTCKLKLLIAVTVLCTDYCRVALGSVVHTVPHKGSCGFYPTVHMVA